MRYYKKISIIILIMLFFITGIQNRVYAKLNEEFFNSNLNIENLIEYINNLDLTEEEVANISEKSKAITKDIKEKASFKDYKLTEIIKIYKNFTSMSKSLKLNIDFSIKNGDFNLKDKANNNSIFKGNISEIKTYFNAIKNNTEILKTEIIDNIDNRELTRALASEVFSNTDKQYLIDILDENIEDKTLVKSIEKILDENNINYESINDNENLVDNEEGKVILNENDSEDISNNETNLSNNKLGSNIIIIISVLLLTCFIIYISYIKFR